MKVLLSVENLIKRFGGLVALYQVNLKVYQGEILALIGPNGSGKTTLFNCISGFYKPEQGKIFWKGEDITFSEPHQIAQKGISRTFQLAKLFSNLTVFENILIAKHMRIHAGLVGSLLKSKSYLMDEAQTVNESEEILKLVGLWEKKEFLARNLPYGSQRLLSLAIALSSKPELLLLDEPSAGMNREETEKLFHILKQINYEGITLIIVEHNMRFIMKISQRMVVLNYGKIICEGSPQVVCKDEAVCAAYLGGEF
ncbi:MAG: ABC transporter ATP-binding protein [Candidatus Anstonellales archaeon]